MHFTKTIAYFMYFILIIGICEAQPKIGFSINYHKPIHLKKDLKTTIFIQNNQNFKVIKESEEENKNLFYTNNHFFYKNRIISL
jgi:hypothetical protein